MKKKSLIILLASCGLLLGACGKGKTSESISGSEGGKSEPGSSETTPSETSESGNTSEKEEMKHQAPFVSKVENPSNTREFKAEFDEMVEDFSGAFATGTTTGVYGKSFLRVLVDSEDDGEPTTPDAAIYKMATGNYEIQNYDGIGFRMRMVGNGELKLSNLVLGLRGDDAFKVYPINLADAVDPDGDALPALTNEYKDFVISPNQSIEDANTLYELVAGGDSTTKVLEKILGFHLYALNEECSAVLEIEEVFLMNAGERTTLDTFDRKDVGAGDPSVWWRGSTGFIVQRGVTLAAGKEYTTMDLNDYDQANLVFTVMGDTSGLKVNNVAYANLKDNDGNALTGAVNGAFYSYVINLEKSELTGAKNFKFETSTEIVISEIFLSDLVNEAPASVYPLIDIANASYVSKFDTAFAKGTIKTNYDEGKSEADSRVMEAGLNHLIAWAGTERVAITGGDLILDTDANKNLINLVIGSSAEVKDYLVLAVKVDAVPEELRIKCGDNPVVNAKDWVADAGLASFNLDDDYPYVTEDGYRLVVIDLERSGFDGSNELNIFYDGEDKVTIGSIFFADKLGKVLEEGEALQFYPNDENKGQNLDLSGYAYIGGFDVPTDAKYLRVRFSSVNGTTLATIRFVSNGEKWFKDDAIIGVDGNPISKDTAIPANGYVDLDIDVEASGFGGASGIHTGGGGTGDIKFESINLLNENNLYLTVLEAYKG